jgi:hypothetical protein
MEVFEKELEDHLTSLIIAHDSPGGDQERRTVFQEVIKWVKGKLLESYKNGIRVGGKERQTKKAA